jgi:ribonuclease P protein component
MAIGRLLKSADFQRLLGTPTRQRSTHFALHHVKARPAAGRPARIDPAAEKLSTDHAPSCPELVDEAPGGLWLGCVVPKRHAKRSVTRSLLKRQMRGAVERHAASLPPGLWLLRLRTPFATAAFPSAASEALRSAVRLELEQLMARTLAVPPRRP